MYSSSLTGYDVDEGFHDSQGYNQQCGEDLSFSDQEEIEQALYAQIHYSQYDKDTEDAYHYTFNCQEKQHEKVSFDVLKLDSEEKHVVERKHESFDDSLIIISETDDSISKSKQYSKSQNVSQKKENKSHEHNEKEEKVIQINSDSDINIISGDDTNDSSDDISDIPSDCMVLDEDFDDMEDIVVHVDKSQQHLLDRLTIRSIKEQYEQNEAGKWEIIDEDRFSGQSGLGRRYYKSNVRCHNCNETGHFSKVCPKPKKTEVCFLCGEDDHNGRSCINPICFNCEKLGHRAADCKEKRRSFHSSCYRCNMSGHSSYECPEIWRQFHLTISHESFRKGKGKENSKKCCPNCAENGHFSFDCEEERMDRHTRPSYQLISQYRKSEIKKQHKVFQDQEDYVPAKKMKFSENEDFPRTSYDSKLNCSSRQGGHLRYSIGSAPEFISIKSKRKSHKWKLKDKEKKIENFEKMMENDCVTFKNSSKNNSKRQNSKSGKNDKKKSKSKNHLDCSKKKKKKDTHDRGSTRDKKKKKKSNEATLYKLWSPDKNKKMKKTNERKGPVLHSIVNSKHKDTSASSKNRNKKDKNRTVSNTSRGFKIKPENFKITFQNI